MHHAPADGHCAKCLLCKHVQREKKPPKEREKKKSASGNNCISCLSLSWCLFTFSALFVFIDERATRKRRRAKLIKAPKLNIERDDSNLLITQRATDGWGEAVMIAFACTAEKSWALTLEIIETSIGWPLSWYWHQTDGASLNIKEPKFWCLKFRWLDHSLSRHSLSRFFEKFRLSQSFTTQFGRFRLSDIEIS